MLTAARAGASPEVPCALACETGFIPKSACAAVARCIANTQGRSWHRWWGWRWRRRARRLIGAAPIAIALEKTCDLLARIGPRTASTTPEVTSSSQARFVAVRRRWERHGWRRGRRWWRRWYSGRLVRTTSGTIAQPDILQPFARVLIAALRPMLTRPSVAILVTSVQWRCRCGRRRWRWWRHVGRLICTTAAAVAVPMTGDGLACHHLRPRSTRPSEACAVTCCEGRARGGRRRWWWWWQAWRLVNAAACAVAAPELSHALAAVPGCPEATCPCIAACITRSPRW